MATRTRSTNGHEHRFSQENLSAYIDQQLSASDRARVERHLQACEACRREMAALKRIIALVSQAPRVHAPRSFALPRTMQPAQAHQRRWEGLFAFARTAAVVASALMLMFFAGDMALTLGWSPFGAARSAQPDAVVVTTQVAELAPEEPVMMLEALPAAEEAVAEKQVEFEPEQTVATVTELEVAEGAAEEAPGEVEPEAEMVAMRALPTPDPRTPTTVEGLGGGGPAEMAVMTASGETPPTGDTREEPPYPAQTVADAPSIMATSEPTAAATATLTTPAPTKEPTPTEQPTPLPPTPEPTEEPAALADGAVAAAAIETQPTEPVADYGLAVQQPHWRLWGWLRTIWMLTAGLVLILLGALVWAAHRKRL